MSPAVVPAATYRLQFNKAFTFDDATGVVEYLDRLGISHCYASSYFKAVPGSTHGYDVADPTRLNPEIGDRDSYDRWVGTLRAHHMGHIIDMVPNHMQEITLQYVDGAFRACYFNTVLPIAPETYDRILGVDSETLLAELGESDAGLEFLSILTAIRRLPGRDAQTPALRAERDREKEVIKRRLSRLTAASPAVLAHVQRAVTSLFGVIY